MKIPEIKIKKVLLSRIESIVGENGYSVNLPDRLSYSRDSNFRAAIQAHYSEFEFFPSVIVWPESSEQLVSLIKFAAHNNIAVTPYGGGSGVCGGAINYSSGITIDMTKMHKILHLDAEHLFADVQTGISGLELEKQLNRMGYTLGHFPSSILSATLGGYLATRSAGQLSSKYGKIEDMIIDLEFVDGTGRIISTSDISRSDGMDLNQLIIGSEGTYGIITKARLKIFSLPSQRLYQAYTFNNIEHGIEALRRIMQTGMKPDVLRLYDELDSLLMFSKLESSHNVAKKNTMPNFLKESFSAIKSKATAMALKAHRVLNELSRLSFSGCILIVMLEGHQKIIDKQLQIISSICHNMNANDIGQDAAIHWHEHRYSVSFKASKLFVDGAFTDTMEVATTWDNLENLYHGVLNQLKPHCLVLAHISHVYNEGAAIYFTMVRPLTGLKASLQNYDTIWDVASRATLEHGGILSHHHGIGRLKKEHIQTEWGEAMTLYKNFKNLFDPHHILNPKILA